MSRVLTRSMKAKAKPAATKPTSFIPKLKEELRVKFRETDIQLAEEALKSLKLKEEIKKLKEDNILLTGRVHQLEDTAKKNLEDIIKLGSRVLRLEDEQRGLLAENGLLRQRLEELNGFTNKVQQIVMPPGELAENPAPDLDLIIHNMNARFEVANGAAAVFANAAADMAAADAEDDPPAELNPPHNFPDPIVVEPADEDEDVEIEIIEPRDFVIPRLWMAEDSVDLFRRRR